MSDQVTIGDYRLEISGDEVLVRDETGAIVEELKLDDVEGELTLPDGKKIDLASILAGNDVAALQTAAGPANDNLGYMDGGPAEYRAFHPADPQFGGFRAAGTLGDTSLAFMASSDDEEPQYDGDHSDQAPVLVTWSSHDPWRIAENRSGGSLGAIIEGDPADFTFKVSDARFEVVNGVLRVRDGVGFDFEFESGIDLDITATSRTGDIKTLSAHVTIADVNEAPTGLGLSGNNLVENVVGAVIGTLTAVDPDSGDTHSFEVSDSRFEVVGGQLKLKDGIALDFETEPSLDVTVTATDSAGNKVEETFTLSVGNANDAQTALALDHDQVMENAAGAVIGTLTVADPDAGDSQSFSVSDDRFEVVNGQLKLKDGVSLDHESEPTIDVQVTATDSGGNQIARTFAIAVGDANEVQTGLTLGNSKVAENAVGAVIGTLTVADPDAGDMQSFSISDDRFEVVNGQLKLKDGVSLDHESEPAVSLQVIATDAGGNQIARTFTIAVGDVNEAQTSLTLGNNNVSENAKGAVIGALQVADPDVGDKQSYSVSDSRFQVVNGRLKLTSGASLDHESEPQVDVKVTATDKSGHQISQTFTVNVGDVNEKQTGIALSASKVSENAAGAVVGTLSVTDPDAGDSQSFKVSDSRFEVVNGQLKLKDGVSLNHESAATVNVKVTATDAANHQISKTFAIGVQDVNEAQTAMTLSGTKVTENASGAIIGTLKVTDPDKGDSQSYSVSDGRFEVVNGQLKLKDGVSLDYEQGSKVSLDVTATDGGNHQITKSFTISVGNAYEAQTGLTLSAHTVKENATGATIGKLMVTDPDAGDRQTFTVSDDRFRVVSNQLRLKTGVSLDFEQGSSVDVDVTATDKGGNQITRTFTVNVTDVNEKQTALTLDNAQVDENMPGGVIGALSVTDPDAGDVQAFKVSDNRFEVVGGQLKLKPGVSFDHETTDSVDVTVTATDGAKHTISQTFTIAIGDVNEAQSALTWAGSTVAEDAAGAVAGVLWVADPDSGDTQTFSVSDGRFEVVNNQLKLKTGASLDYETEHSVDVAVTATDEGGHQIQKTFTVGVADVNEAPGAIQLSSLSVSENAAGAAVGQLTTTDPDAGESFAYQVSDGRFEVANGQLQLKAGLSLDRETEPSVDLKITSTDSAGHSIQQSFTVSVANVNEAPATAAKDGSLESHIVNTSTAYNPAADASVGAYLYSNDSAKVAKPAANLLNGVDPSNMALTATAPLTVTFQKEAAGNHNMVGTYRYDDQGNIVPGSVKFVWLDASATAEGQLGSAMVKDFLGYSQANTVSLGVAEAGSHVGFFAISNGASDGTNKTLLANAAAGTNSQAAAMAAIAGQLSIEVDGNGNGHVYVGNSQMNGDVFFTHDKALNSDFNAGSDIDHMASGVSAGLASQLLIGIEDLKGGGDRDYNDVVFSVNLGGAVNQTIQSAVQPVADFSDIDSGTLSKTVIHTSAFQAGDALNVPASSLFTVTVDHSTADYTITIVGKTGNETVDQYEDFANSISFSTSSTAAGDRHIDYTVTDSGGLTSTPATADITVSARYELSSSQLGNGQTTLGSGDDLLHINTSGVGPTNMGDGHDTVHLASQDLSFGHNEAGKISNAEAIDTTGYGSNDVSLSIDDVLSMTDTDNHLTIIGDKGDTVTLTGDGNSHWTVADTNAEFTTYIYNDPSHQAVVEISNQLNTQVS
ncbi:MAG TPA: cadherin domain-containing protein [Dongiaceae bacterium]|nr:cadherin domain-containing protein [Dongiaceae bacterium]